MLSQEEFDSDKFWKENYINGGTSGHGSYGENAIYKANILNKFFEENDIKEVVEIGCGDGNNLALYKIHDYIGYDISEVAVQKCREKFLGDENKKFFVYDGNFDSADCVICIDVIYHIFPKSRYESMIKNIIERSKRFAIFYTTLHPNMWSEGCCMNDYNFLEYIEYLGYKYKIDTSNPPDSIANFVFIYK